MKLTVFAHTPPPHHGQSYMVKLMVDGFGGDRRGWSAEERAEPAPYGVEVYHVNARLSRSLEDIGEVRALKIFSLVGYCLQAIWCRLRYGTQTLYYVPSPGKRSALVRDWLVMALCRPFYRHIVLHWHAAGLANWLETQAQGGTRATTYRLFRDLDLCMVLSEFNRADAEKLWPQRIQIVHNGIPDPCATFERDVLPLRLARARVRRALRTGEAPISADVAAAGAEPNVVRVLFLAHCTREKGVFDAVGGVRLANEQLRKQGSPIKLRLCVAGSFVTAAEEEEFRAILAAPEAKNWLEYLGFAAGETKLQAFRQADLFCFPTYFYAESFGLVVVEAMAFGVPVVSTRWRAMPEVLPAGYPGLVEPRSPAQIATALVRMMEDGNPVELRRHFERHFTLERHLEALAGALRSIAVPAAQVGDGAGVPRTA